MLYMIQSDTPFGVVFIESWKPGGIPDQDRYHNILKCLDFMTGFVLVATSGLQ